jgi:hypothetical protein
MKDFSNHFFAQETVEGLKEFLQALDLSNPSQAALLYYAQTWFDTLIGSDCSVFNPREYLVEDLSAIMLGKCPVIFMGSNRWAEKTYFDYSEHEKSISNLISRLKALRETYKNQKIIVAIVPEKDYAIDYMFISSGRYKNIEAAIEYISQEIAQFGIGLVFNKQLQGLNKYMQLGDFAYYDSHLTGRNYIQYFGEIIKALGIEFTEIHDQLSMKEIEVYGDLFGRFASSTDIPQYTYLPHYPNAQINLTDGCKSLRLPLRDTWQSLFNKNAIVEGEILILGDSNSSILDERRLTYLASGTFRRTDFYWNPCGVRTDVPESTPDYVLLEIASRFVF